MTNKLIPIEMVDKLIKLEAEEKKIKKQIQIYREQLLTLTQELDVLQLKTGHYTIYRAKRITPKVLSVKTLKDSLDKEQIPYETEEAFTPQMSVMFRELAKQKKELDGLDYIETEYVGIRTIDGKEDK